MTLPVGSILVPVLIPSDATHLTNLSGDGKVWPLDMSIRNIRPIIRNKPTSHAWVPLAILPNGPKRIKKVPEWSENKQEHEAMLVLHDLLQVILRPLLTSARDGHHIKCGDEVVRNCYFRVAGWLADHMENSAIHGIYATRCAICEAPQNRMGELEKYPLRDTQQYQEWVNKSNTDNLHIRGVKFIMNALWKLRDVMLRELVRSDILHTTRL